MTSTINQSQSDGQLTCIKSRSIIDLWPDTSVISPFLLSSVSQSSIMTRRARSITRNTDQMLNIKTSSNSPESIKFATKYSVANSDADREEMKWDDKQEQQILMWKAICLSHCESHAKASKLNKQMYYATSVPVTIFPLLGSTIHSLTSHSCENSSIFVICLSLLTSIVAGVATIFNFGFKDQLHAEFENRYHELSVDIEKEMSKPKRFRIACDVYLEATSSKLNRLIAAAPPI